MVGSHRVNVFEYVVSYPWRPVFASRSMEFIMGREMAMRIQLGRYSIE